jgi:restriction system protein
MAIPDFQTLMLPVLRVAAEGEIRISDAVEKLTAEFGLSPEERSQLLPQEDKRLYPIVFTGQKVTWARQVWWN